MASATDLISNKGTADLGLGSTAAIPVTTSKDLANVERTGQMLMQQNMLQNKLLYDQKLKERDALLAEIDSGKIKVGDLLEKDEPYVKEGLEGLDKAWEERMRKGVNDIDAQRKYKKALRDAQDRVTQAQGRKVFYDQESQALGSEKLPRRQEARKKNLTNVVDGGFWKDLTPYQQTLDNDFDVIKAYPKIQEITVTDPKRPLYKGKRSYVDFNQVKAEADKDFREQNENAEYQIGLLDSFQQMPVQQALPALKSVQNRLMQYNKDRGFNPGDKEFVELKLAMNPNGTPIVTPDGKLVIDESVPDFAAKWALAGQPKYQTEDFNVDKGALDIKKADEIERHNKAMEGLDRSKLSLAFKEFDLKSNAAGANKQMAESAKAYATGLLGKLNGMKNADGIIPADRLRELTADELKYLGSATTTDNKFSLKPLSLGSKEKGDAITNVVIQEDGTIKLFRGGTGKSLGQQVGTSIDVKGIATNKLGDEMIQTAGKEGFNFNSLVELYGPQGQAEGAVDVELSQKPEDWKQEGKNWRYKDVSLYDSKGKKIK